MKPQRVKCSGVTYRQGWIEVTPNIHAGYVNIEAWEVASEVDISARSIEFSSLPDGAVTSNVEVELSIAQAKQFLAGLRAAIEAAERT